MGKCVLLFDADAPIRSFAGGAKDVAYGRHYGLPNLAFADGHAKSANVIFQKTLNWVPTEATGQHQTGL